MKYKINTNDAVTATNKDIVSIKKKVNVKTNTNPKPTINVKKNNKKRILLSSIYLLAFGATTATTILLLNNTTIFSNANFNPNANNGLWDKYYQEHHHDSSPIDLTPTINYFNDSKHIITCNVTDSSSGSNLDFSTILNSIDSNLQTTKPKIETNVDNDVPNLLPIGFFLNVNYNPAVDFTVGKEKKEITNNSFPIPKKFNKYIEYTLNMTTNSEAPNFGIKNAYVNTEITIKVVNQIAVNISNLSFSFADQTISIQNPEKATIDSIKNLILPNIQKEVVSVLSTALAVKPELIKSEYYKIDFVDSTTTKDFTKGINVKFTITALYNPWHFNGKYTEGNIQVKNEIADLNKMTELTKEIQAQYDTKIADKDFQITLNNKKDDKGKYINADHSLSDSDLAFVNDTITKGVQKICQDFFTKNYSNLHITTDDYKVSTNLATGDNIFNHQSGKEVIIKIEANPKTYKLQNNLNGIKTIVHGHNKNNISDNYTNSLNLDGIWLKDGKDPNILQEGQHFYEQTKLLQSWITNADPDGLLNKIKNNSYHPVAGSFTGTFTMNYILDGKNKDSMTSDISKDITGGKATNFWDLISKTKTIFLETDVTTKDGWALNNVKLIFTDTESQPSKDNMLYTFDLSSKFAGIRITDRATLTFPNFNFNFNYQLIS